jgi:hypothetical protein
MRTVGREMYAWLRSTVVCRQIGLRERLTPGQGSTSRCLLPYLAPTLC